MARPRVLIVDDDPDVAEFLRESLPQVEFDVEVCTDASDATRRASSAAPDLALLDVDMPRLNGFEVRDRLRALPGLGNLPVIFVTSAEAPMEVQIARSLGQDRMLIKPVPRVELRRSVYSALGLMRAEEGPLESMLDRVLQSVAEKSETGVLTATRPGIAKRLVFQGGKIVFAGSNDPRDLIGQALLRTGLITEGDLLEAFARPGPSPPRLQSALTAMRKVTAEQSQKAFEEKMRESVLDLFLWKDGRARYVADRVDEGEIPFPFSLPIPDIRAEGGRRRRRWREVQDTLGDPDISFGRTGEWGPGFPESDGDRLLAAAIERGDTLAQILVAFRGQDYAINVRITDLVRRGALRTLDPKGFAPAPIPASGVGPVTLMPTGDFTRPGVSPPPSGSAKAPASQTWATPFEQAVEMLRGGEPDEAHALLLEIAAEDPGNPLLASRLAEAESKMEASARAKGLRDEAEVRLGVPVRQLIGRYLGPGEAFIVSRLASGQMQVANLITVSPFPRFEVLSILRRLLEDGTLKKAG